MIKIEAQVKRSEFAFSERSSEQMKSYVMNHIFNNLDSVLSRYISSARADLVYGPNKLTKRTGLLGKSMMPFKQKINQFSFRAGMEWKGNVPYLNTHVGYGWQTITPKKGTYLTIPIKGSPADVYPRKGVLSFNAKFNKTNKTWFTGRDWEHRINALFVGKTSVRIKRRVSEEDLYDRLEYVLNTSLPKLVKDGVSSFLKRGFK